MKALILSAGHGKRMTPITDRIPKPLIPVLNTAVIEYNIRFLRHYGIREIFINLHHQGEKIMSTLGDGSELDVKIKYLHEEVILGTGGAIGSLKGLVDETFIVINADTIFDFDLQTILDFHKTGDAQVTLGLVSSGSDNPFTQIAVDKHNRITRIIDTSLFSPPEENNAIFTGLHIMEPEILDYIPNDVFVSITTEVYCLLIKQREHINGFLIDGKWWDMGTPENYLKCNFEILNSGPLSYFNPMKKFKHHSVTESDNEKRVVVMGNSVQIPALPVNSPLMIGNNVKINGVEDLGPFLIIGDGVKISGNKKSSCAVYLSKSKGKDFLETERGVIYY